MSYFRFDFTVYVGYFSGAVSLMRSISYLKFGSLPWLFKFEARILCQFENGEKGQLSMFFFYLTYILKLVFSLAAARLVLVF
ncbi:TPA: hypothetical protein ACOLXW_004361 [Vibrio parahaemolyticus]